MDSREIFDVKIRIKNENIFNMVLQAETKYCTMTFPFLTKFQVRGKALKEMGIQTSMGEIPKISKLLPFTYHRVITEPKKQWESLYIQLIFEPVISLAKKLRCIIRNESSFKSLNFQMHLADRDVENKNICNNLTDKLSSKNKENSQCHGESDTSFEVLSPERNEIYEEHSRSNYVLQSNILHLYTEGLKKSSNTQVTEIPNTKSHLKLSESKAVILWPFQTKNISERHTQLLSQQEHSNETCTRVPMSYLELPGPRKHSKKHCITGSKKVRYKNVQQKKIFKNIDDAKESSKRDFSENYISRKRTFHTASGNANNKVSYEETSIISNSEAHEMGYLIGLFKPATEKGLFSTNIMPLIKVRDATSSSSQDI